MMQINVNVFFLYIFPVLVGLAFGILNWKRKRTYLYTIGMLVLCGVMWCVMPHIHTHGSELPGLILWMYSFLSFTVSVVELIKWIVPKGRRRHNDSIS